MSIFNKLLYVRVQMDWEVNELWLGNSVHILCEVWMNVTDSLRSRRPNNNNVRAPLVQLDLLLAYNAQW